MAEADFWAFAPAGVCGFRCSIFSTNGSIRSEMPLSPAVALLNSTSNWTGADPAVTATELTLGIPLGGRRQASTRPPRTIPHELLLRRLPQHVVGIRRRRADPGPRGSLDFPPGGEKTRTDRDPSRKETGEQLMARASQMDRRRLAAIAA